MIDPRNIANGREIPSEGYCDQPYLVKTEDGAWLCTMTTGRGREGDSGQHIVALRSTDQGRTWSEPVDIEPADGPEASWVMPLAIPGGRVYAFYTYNAENMREVIADDPPFQGGKTSRVDTLGEYAFKYSDDGGRTWSQDRHYIPAREMAIDRANPYAGKVRFFWGVGKPVVSEGVALFGFSKVGGFGEGFMTESEACFMRSDNILTEPDPQQITWETLPAGDHGLRSPGGPIADEANLTVLSDGSLFCTYRTIDGHPCHAYSRDGGRTWTGPEYMTYRPGGPMVNHPRAANFVRRLTQGPYAGRYIYWFHNNTARWYNGGPAVGSRNPAWLLGGTEKDGPEGKVIHWGRPEVVLYADHPHAGISYPDFVEDDGRLFIAETQKSVARVHEVPEWVLARLWEDA
jgi:hypothetical protein